MLIKKIPEVSGLATTTVLNTKISEVDNKIPDLNGLVKKTNYDAKILEIEEKYFTTSDDNKFTSGVKVLHYFQIFHIVLTILF